MPSLAICKTPPCPAYRPLKTSKFVHRIFCTWTPDQPSPDAGVDPEIAKALAESFASWVVLFLGGPPAGASHSTWHPTADTTFVARTRGRISQICLTRNPEIIVTLFDQPGFDWSQQGQFALLFPPDLPPTQINPNLTAKAIAHEEIDSIPHLLAYLRPGDDGDFAELAFLDASSLHLWTERLAAIAHRANITFDHADH